MAILQEHARYCQSVRYSPDGNFWASAGFDGKIFLYEGKDSELIGEIQESGGKNAHGGGIYALSWSGNSKSFLTCSGDKTCKIWDAETKIATTTFVMGNAVEDQQLGCLWSGDYLISVSLSGFINYLDPRSPSKPARVVGGHNKPITKISKGCGDTATPTVVTAGSDGRVVEWSVADGITRVIQGDGHGAQVNGLCPADGATRMVTVGIDDSLKVFDQDLAKYETGVSAKLPAQPKGLDHKGDMTVVTTINSIILVRMRKILCQKMNFIYFCIFVS